MIVPVGRPCAAMSASGNCVVVDILFQACFDSLSTLSGIRLLSTSSCCFCSRGREFLLFVIPMIRTRCELS